MSNDDSTSVFSQIARAPEDPILGVCFQLIMLLIVLGLSLPFSFSIRILGLYDHL